MNVREFPVLTDDEQPLVGRLSVGLGDDAARVLAYLLARERADEFDDSATHLAVRVGTGLSRSAAADALSRLEDRDLATASPIRDATRGRPPRAWSAAAGVDATIRRTYDRHARALLDRATRFPDFAAADSSAVEEVPAEPPEETELSLALNWRANGLHAPFFVADVEGAYADRNLRVPIVERTGSREALDAVADGDADLGIVGAGTVLRSRADGEPVVPLALCYQHTTAALYTLRDAFGGPFDRVAQLRGRRVGMPVGSEVGLLGRLFLAQAGVLDDVDLVDVTGEERAALRAGEVEVVTGSFSDPRDLEREGAAVESLLVADHFPIPGPAIVAAEEAVAERAPALAAFLSGTVAGRADANHRPEVAERALDATSADRPAVEREKFERAVAEFDRTDAVETHGWGWQSTDEWDRLRTALAQTDLLAG